jgi:hypothetical protein
MTGEPTLDDIRALFPQWEIWTGISGLLYDLVRDRTSGP